MWARVAVYVLLAGTSGTLVAIAYQNKDLRRDVRRAQIEKQLPHVGHVVPAFATTTLAGDSLTVGAVEAGGRQVLFIFNSECPYCLKTLPSWKEVAGRAYRLHSVSVVGISLDSLVSMTRDYVERHAIQFPVVRFPDHRLARVYRAVGVPLTVVLDDAGTVVHFRAGELSDSLAVDSVLAVVEGVAPEP